MGLRFVPFSGPSSSGDQVLGKHSRPQLEVVSYHLTHPSHLVFWVYNGHCQGPAQVDPEIRIGDGVGEEKTYLFINIRLD